MLGWIVYFVVIVLLCTIICYQLYSDRNRISETEGARLLHNAQMIETNISFQINSTYQALLGIRNDPTYWTKNIGQPSARLKTLIDAMPSIRTINILDGLGNVLTSGRPELVGQNFGTRYYFTTALALPDKNVLVISPPFVTSLGVWFMNIALAIEGPDRGLAHVISATIDPIYINILLESVLYSPDMWVSLNHIDGLRYLMMPNRPNQSGLYLDRPGSFFARYKESGMLDVILTGHSLSTGEDLMVGMTTLHPRKAPINKTLIIQASRRLDAIYRDWWAVVEKEAALFLLLIITSFMGLIIIFRRQRAVAALTANYTKSLIEARETAEVTAVALEESEASFRLMFHDAPDAYLIMDLKDGHIHACNRAAERMLRGTCEQIIGRTPDQLSPQMQPDGRTSQESVPEKICGALEKGYCRFEWIHRRLDGDDFWVDVTISLGTYQRQKVMFVAWREIGEIIAAKNAAEAASRTKSAFLAMMSHELRTPMTGVIGMADFMSGTQLDSDQRTYLDTMRASAKTLLTVLNDILDYSKVDAGQMILEAVVFDAVPLVGETVRLFWPKAEENACSLTVDCGGIDRLVVRGDPTRIKQVLGNLVGNAIKFTHSGRIMIRLRYETIDERLKLLFEIEDTGIGISEADQNRLFQPFAQIDAATNRKFGGTGLGLAISKKLVELMGGEIGVSSHLTRGSTFYFTCFVDTAQSDEIETDVQKPTDVPPLRILLAEDNPINRLIVKTGLEQRNHQVTVVEDGVQAYEAAASQHFDMILMDMQMPTMDGAEATRRIRTLSNPFCDIPIIALTADVLTENRANYMEAGLSDFLTKPIEWPEFDRVIARHHPAISGVDERDKCNRGGKQAYTISSYSSVSFIDSERFATIREMMGDDDLRQLLAELRQYDATIIERVHHHVQDGSLENIHRIAHEVKGMFSNLGAVRVVTIARDLQATETIDAACDLAPNFEATIKETVAALEKEMALMY